jgi:hypothetical protein
MVKHSILPPEDLIFMSERVGKPQWIAGVLLLVFLAQCAWLITRNLRAGEMDLREWYRLDTGLRLWHRTPLATVAAQPTFDPGPPPRIRDNDGFDPDHSALWYLVASAPLLIWPGHFDSASLLYWGWLARLPHLAFGLLLGASLWYVARRLYGNEGGFIALILYCFSPGMIRAASLWYAEPEMGAAWGAFGTLFTGIAVAHTLYAPREVVLWNWRRMVLLGISLALAIGSQFSLFVIAPVALAFMLYLAPTRPGAAAVIWTTACVIALLLLFTAHFFRPLALWEGLRHATWLGLTAQAFTMPAAYRELLAGLDQGSPALVLALPVTLAAYLAWPRARYFGNTAPLLVALLCLVLGLGTPHYQGLGFQLVALPFIFVFVAGISADLLETKHRPIVFGCLLGLLLVYALLSLAELTRAGFAH